MNIIEASKKIEKVIVVSEPTFRIELSKNELCLLGALCGKIGGAGPLRAVTEEIYYKAQAVDARAADEYAKTLEVKGGIGVFC